MSSHEWPNSGYILELQQLRAVLSIEYLPMFDRLKNELNPQVAGDSEQWVEFLNDAIPSEMPRPSGVFSLTEEDFSTDLERGVAYAYFEEDDIYEKTVRPGARELQKLVGDLPRLQHWTKFG